MQYKAKVILSIIFLFLHTTAYGHGFASDTLVQLGDGSLQTIRTVCLRSLHNKISVLSYNVDASCKTNQLVKVGRRSQSNCYIRFGFNDSMHNDIMCTPMQEFYLPEAHTWVPAYMLKVGDALLTKNKGAKRITYIQFVQKPLTIYTLEIEKSHTFFVGNHSVLTHNMLLPMAFNIGLSFPFGTAALGTAGSFFGPIGLIGGVVLGGIIGLTVKAMYEDRIPTYTVPEYDIAFSNPHCYNAIHHVEESNDVHYVIQSASDAVYESSFDVTVEIVQGSCDNIQMPSPEEPKKDDEKDKKSDVRICEKSAQHMFRKKAGHLPDTPVNRELLIEMVSNKENFLGIDKIGNEWYAKILNDGTQIWASARNNVIRNGGLNDCPRIFNPQTGLCRT